VRPVPARVGDLVIAIALFAAGLLFVWQSAVLPFGEVGLPGPGFFPFVLGIVLGLFALAIVVRAIRQRDEGAAVSLGHRDIAVVSAALVCAGFAFERLGAYVTLGVFTAALLWLVARTSFWRGVLGASLGMVAVWAFFKVLLGVQLPAGPF
jgi:putative tricarboxylic transport membrane protein